MGASTGLGPWWAALWAALRARRGVGPTRWVMVDVETSGLDAQHDRLLAIAAIGLQVDWPRRRLGVVLGDSFEVLVRQDQASSKDNILLHGIGVQAQRTGVDAPQAMAAFAQFVGDAPLLAFHAAFDQRVLGRYARTHLGQALPNDWLDIDHLCAVTHGQVRARALDDWLTHFGIHCALRHQATADTLAECELLQRIWPQVARHCASWRDVQRLAGQHRWLPRAP